MSFYRYEISSHAPLVGVGTHALHVVGSRPAHPPQPAIVRAYSPARGPCPPATVAACPSVARICPLLAAVGMGWGCRHSLVTRVIWRSPALSESSAPRCPDASPPHHAVVRHCCPVEARHAAAMEMVVVRHCCPMEARHTTAMEMGFRICPNLPSLVVAICSPSGWKTMGKVARSAALSRCASRICVAAVGRRRTGAMAAVVM
ncbi:hypothetical protein ACLOJK_005153 [Asimina triloba]